MHSQDLTGILKRTRRWFFKSRLGSGLLCRPSRRAARKLCKIHDNAVILPDYLKLGFKVFAVARSSRVGNEYNIKIVVKPSRSEVSTHINLSISQKMSSSTAGLLSYTPISVS